LCEPFGNLAGNLNHVILPVPLLRRCDNGSHAGNKLAFQGYFIIPVGAETFTEAMRIGANCHHTLKGISSTAIIPRSFGDEGGFAPPCGAREGHQAVRLLQVPSLSLRCPLHVKAIISIVALKAAGGSLDDAIETVEAKNSPSRACLRVRSSRPRQPHGGGRPGL